MRLGKILMVLCIAVAVVSSVFGIASSVYAKGAKPIEDTKGGSSKIEDELPNTSGPAEKGSPLHAWRAIVAADKKVGDIITTKEFEGMRNWSATTRGYELKSLVAIGVLERTTAKGEYRLVVDATPEQIDRINNEAKPIVNKISRDGTKTALGIDTWILDTEHLGEGKVEQIAVVVRNVTGSSNVMPVATFFVDFIQEDIKAKTVYASVAINGDMPFTIDDFRLSDKESVADEDVTNNLIEQQNLLAALVDIRIVSPEGNIKGAAVNFSATNDKAKTVMFEEGFVTDNPEGFAAEFGKLDTDQMAVIIAINKSNNDIKIALQTAGLLEQWGNRIVVMGVKPDSPSADAFRRLFGDSGKVDLRGQTIDKILKSRDLVVGLKGTV